MNIIEQLRRAVLEARAFDMEAALPELRALMKSGDLQGINIQMRRIPIDDLSNGIVVPGYGRIHSGPIRKMIPGPFATVTIEVNGRSRTWEVLLPTPQPA